MFHDVLRHPATSAALPAVLASDRPSHADLHRHALMKALSEIGGNHTRSALSHLVEEGPTSRIRAAEVHTVEIDGSRKTYGVKAADWGITRAGENETAREIG